MNRSPVHFFLIGAARCAGACRAAGGGGVCGTLLAAVESNQVPPCSPSSLGPSMPPMLARHMPATCECMHMYVLSCPPRPAHARLPAQARPDRPPGRPCPPTCPCSPAHPCRPCPRARPGPRRLALPNIEAHSAMADSLSGARTDVRHDLVAVSRCSVVFCLMMWRIHGTVLPRAWPSTPLALFLALFYFYFWIAAVLLSSHSLDSSARMKPYCVSPRRASRA